MERSELIGQKKRNSYGFLFENREGFRIWMAIVISIIVMFIHRQYLAVMSDFIMSKYSINISQATSLVNASLYGYALIQIPAGIMADKIGVRRLMISGWLITFCSTVVIALTSSYPVALFMRFLIGCSTAVSVISVMKVQALWFDERYFSQLSALMALVSNLGNLLSTVPLSYLIIKVGEQASLWVIALMTLFCVGLNFLFVKDKPRGEKEDFQVGRALREVFFNLRSFPPMIITLTFISVTTSLVGFWGIQYLSSTYELNTVEAAKYMIFLSVGFMLGSPLVSFMDHLTGRNNKRNLQVFTGIFLIQWLYISVICKGRPPLSIMPLLLMSMGIVIMFHLLPFTVAKEVNLLKNSGIATSAVNAMEFVGSSVLNSVIGFFVLGGVSVARATVVYFISAVICFTMTFFLEGKKKSFS